MPVARQQCVYRLQVIPVLGETCQVKLVPIRKSLECRGAIDVDVCLKIAPDLGQSQGNNHCAAIDYTFRNCLHQRAALQRLVEPDQLKGGCGVRIGPSAFGYLHNRFHRKNCIRIESPAKLVQYGKRIVFVRKAESRYILGDWLKTGELRRCAFNRDLALNERVFKCSRETGPDCTSTSRPGRGRETRHNFTRCLSLGLCL